MQIQYNRRLAAVVLAVSVLVSIFGLGGMGLVRERRKAVRVFEEGTDTSFAMRYSVDAYLDNCAGYARIMAEECRMRADSDAADEVLDLAARVESENDLSARQGAYSLLCAAVETLYSDFHADTDDEVQQDFDRAYANFKSEVKKIGYDEYNAMARQFNGLRKAIPAGLIAGLYRVDDLATFE